MSGEYVEFELARDTVSITDSNVVTLSTAEWNEQMNWLASMFGTRSSVLARGRVTGRRSGFM